MPCTRKATCVPRLQAGTNHVRLRHNVHRILLCQVNRFCSNLCKPMSGRRSLLFPTRAFNPAWLQRRSGLSLVEVILEFSGYERKQHPRNKACIEPRSMSSFFVDSLLQRMFFNHEMIISIVHCELGLEFLQAGSQGRSSPYRAISLS